MDIGTSDLDLKTGMIPNDEGGRRDDIVRSINNNVETRTMFLYIFRPDSFKRTFGCCAPIRLQCHSYRISLPAFI